MDTAILIALIGVGTSFLGVAGTATVAIYAQVQTNRREEKRLEQERKLKELQQDHERELKRLDLENTKQEKSREERIKAYREFINATRQGKQASLQMKLTEPSKKKALAFEIGNRMNESYSELSILAPPMVIGIANKIHTLVREASRTQEGDIPEPEKQEIEKYLGFFLSEVRKDLEIYPEETDPFVWDR